MNEKILQVVGIILSKPSIDAKIIITRYSKGFGIILQPKKGWFKGDLMVDVVSAFPSKTVLAQFDDEFGLHLQLTFSEDDYEAD